MQYSLKGIGTVILGIAVLALLLSAYYTVNDSIKGQMKNGSVEYNATVSAEQGVKNATSFDDTPISIFKVMLYALLGISAGISTVYLGYHGFQHLFRDRE